MKLVFFDIDDTLLDHNGQVPESSADAIAALQRNGHKAILCSGRSRGFIREKELLSLHFDGIISGCGTQIEYEDQILLQRLIDKFEGVRIVERVNAHAFPTILEGPRYLYLDREDFPDDPYTRRVEDIMGDDLRSIRDNWGNWEFNKFSCVVNHETLAAFLTDFAPYYTPIFHSFEVVEMVPSGFDKSSGMAWLSEHLGVPQQDTLAFGDGMNDMGMLHWAGIGIAMGNGNERVKVSADYVTDDIHQDGVANALRHFGLI